MISEPFFWKKAWAIVQGNFLEIGSFFKMVITQKFEPGIGSNFLHNIRTSICIRKCNKNGCVFSEPFFRKKHGLHVYSQWYSLSLSSLSLSLLHSPFISSPFSSFSSPLRFQLNKVRLMHQKLMPYLQRLVPSLLGMLRKCSLK